MFNAILGVASGLLIVFFAFEISEKIVEYTGERYLYPGTVFEEGAD